MDIHDFLVQLEEEWKNFPDLRFGQLIANVLDIGPMYKEGPNGYEIEGIVCKTDPFCLTNEGFFNLIKTWEKTKLNN